MPQVIPPRSVLPDDYLRGELHTSDSIIRVNIETHTGETLFEQSDFDIADIVVAKDGSMLFFVDRTDGTLWGLKLK